MPKTPTQVLLRPNYRALVVGCLPPLFLSTICLTVMAYSPPDSAIGVAGFALSGLFLVFSLAVLAGLVVMAFLPRVALTSEHLLVYLRGYRPYRVPLDAVECFFQGQGTAALPNTIEAKSTNVVIRLAERSRDWHDRQVKRSLGDWCDGYIIIRGTWCEPISEDKLRSLNSDLANAKRNRKATASA